MSAGIFNITDAEQGATYNLTITLNDSDGAPIDLTGCTFRGKVKSAYSDTTEVASFTFTLRDQTSETGMVDAEISADDMASLPVTAPAGTKRTATKFVYDIEYENLSGVVKRALQGFFEVSPEVTT